MNKSVNTKKGGVFNTLNGIFIKTICKLVYILGKKFTSPIRDIFIKCFSVN